MISVVYQKRSLGPCLPFVCHQNQGMNPRTGRREDCYHLLLNLSNSVHEVRHYTSPDKGLHRVEGRSGCYPFLRLSSFQVELENQRAVFTSVVSYVGELTLLGLRKTYPQRYISLLVQANSRTYSYTDSCTLWSYHQPMVRLGPAFADPNSCYDLRFI
jgi:hypothetical protein